MCFIQERHPALSLLDERRSHLAYYKYLNNSIEDSNNLALVWSLVGVTVFLLFIIAFFLYRRMLRKR
jgi:hypothetical protein